jgi:hypothetical protein
MKLDHDTIYLVQRDYGGIPVVIDKNGEEVTARTAAGHDLPDAFVKEITKEVNHLPMDSIRTTGLLYAYKGWTRQPRAIVRKMIHGRRDTEGLAPRLDLIDMELEGNPLERWEKVREMLSQSMFAILRPALTDIMSGGDCEMLARLPIARFHIRSADQEEAVIEVCGEGEVPLRVGDVLTESLGDGLSVLRLLDRGRHVYAEPEAIGMELDDGAIETGEGYACAYGDGGCFRLHDRNGFVFKESDQEYEIEREEEYPHG